MAKPYSKEQQTQVKAGTKEAAALLKRSAPKYRNKKTADPKGGRMFDSKLEADYDKYLTYQQQAGEIHSFRRQVCLKLIVNGILVCRYFIDFVVTHNDGRLELIEVKGFETPVWKKKWNLTKALLPKGEIPDIPKDSRLTLVKRGKRGEFSHFVQGLNYGE